MGKLITTSDWAGVLGSLGGAVFVNWIQTKGVSPGSQSFKTFADFYEHYIQQDGNQDENYDDVVRAWERENTEIKNRLKR